MLTRAGPSAIFGYMKNQCTPDELLDGLVKRLAVHAENLGTFAEKSDISESVLRFLLSGYRNPTMSTLRKLHHGLEKMSRRRS